MSDVIYRLSLGTFFQLEQIPFIVWRKYFWAPTGQQTSVLYFDPYFATTTTTTDNQPNFCPMRKMNEYML